MSTATTTVPSEPAPLDRNIVHRCCALKVSGDQCRQFALRGQNYCVAHVSREPHVFDKPGHIIIPLLEDAAAVQLTATKILSGLANGTIKPDVANAMNHTLNTVIRTLPRPAPLKPGHSQPRQQPALLTVDDNGAWVAPPEPWLDDSGNITTYDQLAPTATSRAHRPRHRRHPQLPATHPRPHPPKNQTRKSRVRRRTRCQPRRSPPRERPLPQQRQVRLRNPLLRRPLRPRTLHVLPRRPAHATHRPPISRRQRPRPRSRPPHPHQPAGVEPATRAQVPRASQLLNQAHRNTPGATNPRSWSRTLRGKVSSSRGEPR